MEKERIVVVGLIIIFLMFFSLYLDADIIKIVSLMRSELADDFFIGITLVSSGVIIFFFLTSLFLWQENKRKWIFPLWFSLFLSAAVSFLLKIIIQRQRPFQLGIVSTLPVLESASQTIWNFSFPSFQAMLAFSAVPILSKEFPKFKKVWVIFAVLVAFSRVYFGLHFLSDALAGSLIGYLIGWFVIKTEKETKFWERIYKGIFRK